MHSEALLTLPPELLDRIFAYLDWDRTAHFTPHRPDIFNISLSCRHLRHSVIPLLFRNVTLCLRWVDGELLEPALYRLRRETPHLAQHIRTVYIRSRLGFRPGRSIEETQPTRFAAPEDLEDWLSPELALSSGESEANRKYYERLHASHRDCIDKALRELYERVSQSHVVAPEVGTAEQVMRSLVAQTSYASLRQKALIADQRARGTQLYYRSTEISHAQSHLGSASFSLDPREEEDDEDAHYPAPAWHMGPSEKRIKRTVDALAVVMLCLPPTVTEMVFQGDDCPDAYAIFALHVAAALLEVYATRLEILGTDGNELETEDERTVHTITQAHVAGVTNLRTLRLARMGLKSKAVAARQNTSAPYELTRWHGLPAEHLRSLEIWDTDFKDDDLDTLLKSFEHFSQTSPLKSVSLRNVSLTDRRSTLGWRRANLLRTPAPATPLAEVPELMWLRFLISLRRTSPATRMELSGLSASMGRANCVLGPSATHWLSTEALPPFPVGFEPERLQSVVDFQREERLLEDFESLLPLWEAEDSARGEDAAKHRLSKGGELADAAMCSRWRTVKNVTMDQGEWLTI
ncbi:hypothetical protein B0A50_04463 [Salinomyces thailandicus]|uniref:F-box domain-containing protein n=1 Tax=Salinomyces thailandicus TaxID=706561 RepID=A0A4U0TYL5_9PEZI|nr:hypothetical protein B0A50_04463 [Salinomyces thailandica]